jgi:ketosteroid isomerase-like protein
MPDLTELAKSFYAAFAGGDRERAEELLAPDFTFSSPIDVGLDRDGFFDRCWPGAGRHQTFRFIRLVQSGDEVFVTYEQSKPDGTAGRNTEVLTFRGSQLRSAEVYFGWDVPA